MQQFSAPNVGNTEKHQLLKDKPVYVGMNPHSNRIDTIEEKAKSTKKGMSEGSATLETVNKFKRTISDGLLLVVPTKVYEKEVKTVIDSGATRCFVTPSYVTRLGLKGISQNTFLKLGNGQKYLSRGYVPDVPVVIAGLIVKVGLTVTNLLHEVDLVLGMNWLQLVNPVVDWGNGRLYIPNAVHTALLQGDWLEGHVRSGTVTVLSSVEELKCLQDERMQRQISILKNPKLWTDAAGSTILRTKFSEGHAKYDVEWGKLYSKDCNICKKKGLNVNECKNHNPCKIYVIKDEEGIVRVRRMNVNAKLPMRSSSGSAGYDLSAAETAVVPAHGKCPVKTGLARAMPPGCYGRVAPRSGLAVKTFIDVGGRSHRL